MSDSCGCNETGSEMQWSQNLIEACRNGDPEALRVFCQLAQKVVVPIVRTWGVHENDVPDVTQNAIIAVVKKLRAIKSPQFVGVVINYLRQAAKSKAYDWEHRWAGRQERRQPSLDAPNPTRDGEVLADCIASKIVSPAKSKTEAEFIELMDKVRPILRQAVHGLEQRYRRAARALSLRFGGGKSYAEIAKALNTTVARVMQLLKGAVAKLKTLIIQAAQGGGDAWIIQEI